MVRPTTPTDTPTLVTISQATAVFKPHEIVALREVLDDYHHHAATALGHRCVTEERDAALVGFAYFAPEAMTDGAWSLWWIVVDPSRHARGIGGELLRYVEREIVAARGRVLFIDTSSLPHYELTRRFYLKHGYEQAAQLRDFYSAGDDKVIFRKALLRT